MFSLKPKIRQVYTTITGLPVQVTNLNAESIILQSLTYGNRFTMPAGYPLCRKQNYQSEPLPHKEHFQKTPKPLSAVIDALLLAGGKTMRGIVGEVKRKASAQCKDKDVHANVRARIYWFRKKGYRVEKNEQDHIQVIPN